MRRERGRRCVIGDGCACPPIAQRRDTTEWAGCVVETGLLGDTTRPQPMSAATRGRRPAPSGGAETQTRESAGVAARDGSPGRFVA